jgi:UDP-3-O-[3-hydroxymyristoyl] glucosamine N-acyltransferase
MNASLCEIANLVQGQVVGNDQIIISSLSPIDNIASGSLIFADSKENLLLGEKSDAAAILVSNNTTSEVKPVIQVTNPFQAFIQVVKHFYPSQKTIAGIHPTAVIAPGVILGKNLAIGPYVTIESGTTIGDNCVIKDHVSIGAGVTIGEDTVLHPHVTIYEQCQIGARVSIHAATVVGSDGFGYTWVDNQHRKVPHVGNVIIEDDVEIGANTVIDRATLGSTVIGAGTKIDNLVQVAHSVKLGKHNILCAFTGIAGSTTSGNQVIFAANVGVSDHVHIDDGVILGARAGVPPKKHLKQGIVYLGNPARPKEKAIEQELSVTRIPIMRKNLQTLTAKVAQLSERLSKDEPEVK